MKNKIFAVAVLAILLMLVAIGSVASANGGGFNQYGYNYQARLFNGWYGTYENNTNIGTLNAWLVMKWSTNWSPMASEPTGAWVTNHWTWYSGDLNPSDWYGFGLTAWTDQNQVPSGATYYITEFMKIQAVGDNPIAWATYEAHGAYDAGWGDYTDGVPNYVVFQDVVSIYNLNGNLIQTIQVAGGPGMGLGQPIF